jgi:murein DD-endopeptidase MepM/ murein hydrolase activator NlpD
MTLDFHTERRQRRNRLRNRNRNHTYQTKSRLLIMLTMVIVLMVYSELVVLNNVSTTNNNNQVMMMMMMMVVVGATVSSSSSSTTALGEGTEESITATTAIGTVIGNTTTNNNNNNIPIQFDAPFGSYPNLLNISAEERNLFSPIIIYPKWVQSKRINARRSKKNYVNDKRQASEELASPEEILIKKQQRRRLKGRWLMKEHVIWFGRNLIGQIIQSNKMLKRWNIGKYDENRDGGMYVSDLFDDTTNKIDGYGGQRTIHLGIDLGGPVGTNIYSFSDGIIHSIGYNPLLGDYGNVIVIEHSWDTYDDNDNDKIDNTDESTTESTTTTTTNAASKKKKCWTLYGHLDESVLTTTRTTKHDSSRTATKRKQRRQSGDIIKKGEIIGRIGNIDENGGWIHSHLHFQVSMKPPDQPHDMPGASSIEDRNIALKQYFDPRYILGPIY